MSTRVSVVIAVLLVVGVSFLTSQLPTAGDIDLPPVEEGEVRVILRGWRFLPDPVKVAAGTKVTFVNTDPVLHDVVQVPHDQVGEAEPGFASPLLSRGDSWSITFREPGEYPIVCVQANHWRVGMVSSVIVEPGSGGI